MAFPKPHPVFASQAYAAKNTPSLPYGFIEYMCARGGLMEARVTSAALPHPVASPKIISLPQVNRAPAGHSTEPVFRTWVISAREHPELPYGFVEWLAGFHRTTVDSHVLRSAKMLEFVRVFDEQESELIA